MCQTLTASCFKGHKLLGQQMLIRLKVSVKFKANTNTWHKYCCSCLNMAVCNEPWNYFPQFNGAEPAFNYAWVKYSLAVDEEDGGDGGNFGGALFLQACAPPHVEQLWIMKGDHSKIPRSWAWSESAFRLWLSTLTASIFGFQTPSDRIWLLAEPLAHNNNWNLLFVQLLYVKLPSVLLRVKMVPHFFCFQI